MTTILVDFEEQTVYADKQTTWSGTSIVEHTTEVSKIVKRDDRVFVGYGCASNIDSFIKNYPHLPSTTKEGRNAGVLVIEKSGEGLRVKEYVYKKQYVPFTNLFSLFSFGWHWLPSLKDTITGSEGYLTRGSGKEIALVLAEVELPIEKVFSRTAIYDEGTSAEYDAYCFKTETFLEN